jgi:hypothetical protein
LCKQIGDLSANLFPLIVQGAGGSLVALRKTQHAPPRIMLPVGGVQHGLDRNLIRWAGEFIAAVKSLERPDNPLPSQFLQDLPQEGHGDFLGSRYFSRPDEGPCRLLRQEGYGPDSVFG